MAVVNLSVYCLSLKRMLLSWCVFSTETPDTTFCTRFSEKLKPSISHECELERVYVGRDKVCLDETDMNLNVGQVTSMFGSFIKYTVQSVQNSTSSTVQLTYEMHLKSCSKASKGWKCRNYPHVCIIP